MATKLIHKIAKVAIFIFLRWSHFGKFVGFGEAMVTSHHLQMSIEWRQS